MKNYANKSIGVGITDTFHPEIRYKGFVKILYIDKNNGKAQVIRKQNSGGYGLFTAITRALAGYPVHNHIPVNLMAYDAAGNPVFAQNIGYSSAPILYQSTTGGDSVAINIDENINMIQYTFMIPANSLIATTDIAKLVLYNKLGQECAILELSSGQRINTTTGSNILIYWKLKFE